MRALFSTLPGLGHFHPMVPLARAMREAGHEVAFATSASFCPTVKAVGFEAFPAGFDWTESEVVRTIPALLTERPDGQVRIFAGLGDLMCEDLVEIGEQWRADVLIREPTEFGAWVAAEQLGLPHITVGIMIRLPGPILNMLAGPQLADLLSAKGLAPDPELEGPFRHLYLDLMPPSFVPDDWPPASNVHHVRPVPFDTTGEESLPEWTKNLGSRPVVYATLGTVFNQAPATFRCIIEAFADSDVDLIVTVGRNGDPNALGALPTQVHVERYIPQTQLMARCDVVISHGGYGTLMSALTHGLPTCFLPTSADQCFGAHRSTELGIGLSLATHYANDELFPHVGPGDLEPEKIRYAVDRLLTEPTFGQAARSVQNELEQMQEVEHAVSLIEAAVDR